MRVGIDVFSGNGAINWDAARATGNLGFVGVRTSEALRVDSLFTTYVAELEARGIPWFPWMLLRFEQNGPSPEDQAHVALDVVSAMHTTTDPQKRFTHCVDLEFPGGRKKYGITAGQALEWFLRCYQTMKAGLGGADPGVYASNVEWIDPDGLNNLPCPEIENAWSWMKYYPYPTGTTAHYDSATISALHEPPVAPPFHGNWNIHQFQGDAIYYPGVHTACDMNRAHVVKQGDVNGTVAWIQRQMKRAGIAVVADGNFGPKTKLAVETFQTSRKLTADGIVGYDTSACLSHVV